MIMIHETGHGFLPHLPEALVDEHVVPREEPEDLLRHGVAPREEDGPRREPHRLLVALAHRVLRHRRLQLRHAPRRRRQALHAEVLRPHRAVRPIRVVEDLSHPQVNSIKVTPVKVKSEWHPGYSDPGICLFYRLAHLLAETFMLTSNLQFRHRINILLNGTRANEPPCT